MPASHRGTMSLPDRHILAGRGLNLAAVRFRVGLVADALALPASEVERAMSNPEQSLIHFAAMHGQNIDWILFGHACGVVRDRLRRHGAAPNTRLPS